MIYDMQEIKAAAAAFIKSADVIKVGKQRYIELCCGYDTETTRLHKHSYIYHFQVSFNTAVFGFRTWENFLEFFDFCNSCIERKFRNSKKKPLLIWWVANLSFEFQFLKDRRIWNIFATGTRQPLTAQSGNIILREALKISGSNLAHLAKTFCSTRKMTGDLDYSKLRNSSTPLTAKEKQYMENDVIILSEWARYIFNQARTWGAIPYTSTGIIRRECRQRSKSVKGWKQTVKEWYFDKNEYNVYMHYLYRGGFVHANRVYADKVLKDVVSYDKKSSYPAQMLQQYFPSGKFKSVPKFERWLCDRFCCIIDVKFYSIRSTTFHSIESSHKIIESIGAKFDNGRLISADMVHVLLTELDYKTYEKFYTWARAEYVNTKIAHRGKLPKFLTDITIEKFDIKEKTKKDTTEYFLAKRAVNGLYGMTCTKHHTQEIVYSDGEWRYKQAKNRDGTAKTFDDFVENDFLLPYYGIWISAHARYDLLCMVYENKHHVCYCDTDSIYFVPGFDPKKIEARNAELRAINRAGKQAAYPELGCYEYEGQYKRSKFLGAKRYIKEHYLKDMKHHRYKVISTRHQSEPRHHKSYYLALNPITQTIAGLGKSALYEYCNKNHLDPFDVFKPDMVILNTFTSKLITHYEDKPHSDYIDGELMQELSSVSLLPSDFKLHLTKEYLNLLLLTKKGRDHID